MGSAQQALIAAAGTPGPFSPIDEPTLDWWLKADAITGLNDGDPVTDWLDSSTAGKHYGQDTAGNKPTYKTGIVNGKPVVRFATDDKLVADPDPRTLSAANTLIIVCTPTSGTDDYIFGGTATGGCPAFISGFSSKAFEYFGGNGAERQTFAALASGFHILSLTRTDDSGNYDGYFDGTQVFSEAVSGTSDWSGQSIQDIGANGQGLGDDFFNGDIAEIIHCSSVVGASRLTEFHNYLGDKYAITVP